MIVRDKIYIPIDTLGRKITGLVDLFTYKNPEYYRKKRLKLSVKKTSQTLIHYSVSHLDNMRCLFLPRGGLKRVLDYYKEHDLLVRIADERIELLTIDCHLKNTTLEPQQDKIIKTLIDNEGGLIQMDTGGGKTISILGLIAKLKQPTLIVVHEHKLRGQWEEEIENRLGGNFVLGRYDGDEKREGNICTAVINTLYNMVESGSDILNQFGLIIGDECHRFSSNMWLGVMHRSSSKYRVGVTATVERKDGNHILTLDIVGDMLLDITASEVKHRITTFEYEMIDTNISFEIPTRNRWTGHQREDVLDITAAISLLAGHEERNGIILEHISRDIEAGYIPLVLSDRVAHSKYLHKRLQEFGYNSVLLIGATRKKTNWTEIRKDESVQVVVASSSIAAEGLDYPRLSSLHITTPTSNLPKLKQKVGRIRRFIEGKPVPVVRDYVDNKAFVMEDTPKYVLKYSALNRKKFYEKTIQNYVMGDAP